MSAKYMSNIKLIGAFARLYCFVEICWNLHPFSELKNVFFANFRTFLKFSKCKALGDLLISVLERVPLKGWLGGISQNWNFWNWFEILGIFRHWLLNRKSCGETNFVHIFIPNVHFKQKSEVSAAKKTIFHNGFSDYFLLCSKRVAFIHGQWSDGRQEIRPSTKR